MKNITIYLLLIFFAASSAAQNPVCPPQNYYPVKFDYPPRFLDDDPQLSVPPFFPPTSDLRGIYWVHGLGGNSGSMAQIASATDFGAANFPARKTVGLPMSYEQTGLVAAGNTLVQNMITFDGALLSLGVNDFSQNFIIAHSQGGMTSRMADKLLDQLPETARRHYGIVTIGSPHLGAKIVNSRNDGRLQEFTSDACEAILSTSLVDILDKFKFLDLFVDLSNQQQNIHDLCNDASGAILPFAVGKLFSGASNDYAVGASVLGELQGHNNPETHKTSFYGVEFARPQDDPTDNGFLSKQLIWRMLGTLPDAVSNAPVFGANDDQDLVDKANGTMADYLAEYENYANEVFFYELQGMPCNWFKWMFNPGKCLQYDAKYWNALPKRNAYHKALQWSQLVDSEWKIIIGAKESAITSYTCECYSLNTDQTFIVPGVGSSAECAQFENDNSGDVEKCKWLANYSTGIHEADGVVIAESQKGFPGTSGNFRMNNANHFQERNSEPTRIALLKLFVDGNGDGWFATLPK